ncbi:hypothetical protein [Actinoplanes solisilvae]|uniref:hypothetical protein n=1 Tax=Actinoplanes solisilvae TaxID=2486853 RepID=UPI0013E2AE9A|nr:hypothetical protein [Actinoplanes solisilvae]
MSDNLGPLRRAMSDLAEHGGNTDLHERVLTRSRKLQRRTTVAAGAAATVAVLAVGGVVAVTSAGGGPSTPVATQVPTPAVTTTTAAPTTTTPSTTTTPTSKPPSSSPTSKRPRYPDCPTAKALERLYELPQDWRFVKVHCWRTWATARVEGPNLGDGAFLFRYKASTGWRYHSQGSAFNCNDLGITSGNPTFCSYQD